MQYRTNPEENGSGARKDVYQIVTERIISKLEQGTVPWRQPWTDAGIPRNFISKRPYRGINVMLLSMLGYEHNLFLTFNQLQELGGYVERGERAHMVVFWNYIDVSVSDRNGDTEVSDKRKVPYLRYYMVFNIAQCEGIPTEKIPATEPLVPINPIPLCEQIYKEMPQRPELRHTPNTGAFYDPLMDYINMPMFSTFNSAESYYSTLFHEMAHSTGHHSRLNRKDLLQMQEFNRTEAYSQEELVAEICSCYLMSYAGITTELEQSAGYIDGWLSKLRGDRKFIFSAATHAQKASDFILNLPSEVLIETKPKPDNRVGLLYLSQYSMAVPFLQLPRLCWEFFSYPASWAMTTVIASSSPRSGSFIESVSVS